MLAARGQAERYAKALPASEGCPPFLIVADVGHSIEIYADFSADWKSLPALSRPANLPHQSRRSCKAGRFANAPTRRLWLIPTPSIPRESVPASPVKSRKLAILARNLELKYEPKEVAEFLTRCIFTSFAEDVGLLPKHSSA